MRKTTRFTTVGEAMAVLIGQPGANATPVLGASYELGVGGAESNVAMTLAALGHDVSWVSAVGDDPFGELVVHEVSRAGVDVSGVVRDATAPTGVYFKTPIGSSTDVRYYRRGSAASRLDRGALAVIGDADIVHLSGILPALSPETADLAEAIVVERRVHGLVSLDVNHRPALWPDGSAAEHLLRLAAHSDTVFVGRDEAERVWGAATPRAIRALMPGVEALVVKDAEHGATMFAGDASWHVPSPFVDVVEPVGAGDAFAAGWLSAHARGAGPSACLAFGHAVAERALRERGDLAVIPSRAAVELRADTILQSARRGDT